MPHWFAHPWFLTALAALPLLSGLGFWCTRRRRRDRARLGLRTALWSALPRPNVWRNLRDLALGLGLLLAGVGLAGPQWGRDWEQSAAPGHDLIVIVDCSRSMLAETPSRLERARAALIDLAATLQQHGGHRVALVAFAGKPRLLCPLTHDYDHFRSTLNDLLTRPFDPDLAPGSGKESGTRLGAGIHEALQAMDRRFLPATALLLLSDGDDPAQDGEWEYGTLEAKTLGVPVHTVGIGDPDRPSTIPDNGRPLRFEGKEVQTRLEEAVLQQIDAQTGGQYTAARTRALPLGQVYLDLAAQRDRREVSPDALPVYRQRYLWVLLPAVGLLLLTLVLPDDLLANGGAGR
jgi:Ca-activated chloride channel family protein